MDVKEHLVSLKGKAFACFLVFIKRKASLFLEVMRLLKPSLYSSLPIYAENEHFTENFAKLLLDQIFETAKYTELNTNSDFSMSDSLVIPQIFGYDCETFSETRA